MFPFPEEEIYDTGSSENEDGQSKLPMQLAIVGRPNVGKSTLLNAILQENRVLVGPEAGLTRDSVRVQFQYEGRNIFLVSLNFLILVVYLTHERGSVLFRAIK